MKTPDDYVGQAIEQRPKRHNLTTLKVCKSCARAKKTSRGYFCLLRCKPCGVPENSVNDDCVNQEKATGDDGTIKYV